LVNDSSQLLARTSAMFSVKNAGSVQRIGALYPKSKKVTKNHCYAMGARVYRQIRLTVCYIKLPEVQDLQQTPLWYFGPAERHFLNNLHKQPQLDDYCTGVAELENVHLNQ